MVFSVFESALSYWFVAASFLRLAVGIVAIILAKRALGKEREHNSRVFAELKMIPGKFYSFIFGFIILICGILLILGLFTQIAAIILGVLSVLIALLKTFKESLEGESVLFFSLLAVTCFSIIYFGAGSIALDLPL